jgi:hypothetical protein
MLTKRDVEIVRQLAKRVREIALLPVQEEKKSLWRKLNALKPVRPMVMIDQVCWNEMNPSGELTLQCESEECCAYEQYFRRLLFQWNNFPVDMVVEPVVKVPKAIYHTGFNIQVHEEVAVTDKENDVISHRYENQFRAEEDLDKIQVPLVVHDSSETDRRLDLAGELFNGLLDVLPWGVDPYLSLWDPIATWMGAENALFAIVDRPDFMHRLLKRMTDGYLGMLDQLEEQGLLCGPQSLIHCTGAYTDDLPTPHYDPCKPRTQDLWMFGLAQMLSMVSPRMFREFEVDYTSRICDRFGLVYYGCCDPLDGKMAEVRLIPNVRKISMSPWVNQERGAQQIGCDYVYSRKPNPAFLAENSFRAEFIREDLLATRRVCETHGCPLEIILKDISTVHHKPERLSAWAQVAMQVVGEK